MPLREHAAILAAGVRRFALIIGALASATFVLALAFAALTGGSTSRAASIAFDLVGVFFLVAGFFVGNRGPVRMKDPRKDDPMGALDASAPVFGQRRVRWATPGEREAALSDSAVFVAVGLAMIVIGIAIDGRYRVF
jgi:hypothetical protein